MTTTLCKIVDGYGIYTIVKLRPVISTTLPKIVDGDVNNTVKNLGLICQLHCVNCGWFWQLHCVKLWMVLAATLCKIVDGFGSYTV